MSKHTGAPWKIEEIDIHGTPAIRILAPDGTANAWVYDTHHPENAANAQLIAAAPDLLEIVRWVAQTVHQAHHLDQPGTFHECPKNTCKAAHDAIEKALHARKA